MSSALTDIKRKKSAVQRDSQWCPWLRRPLVSLWVLGVQLLQEDRSLPFPRRLLSRPGSTGGDTLRGGPEQEGVLGTRDHVTYSHAGISRLPRVSRFSVFTLIKTDTSSSLRKSDIIRQIKALKINTGKYWLYWMMSSTVSRYASRWAVGFSRVASVVAS